MKNEIKGKCFRTLSMMPKLERRRIKIEEYRSQIRNVSPIELWPLEKVEVLKKTELSPFNSDGQYKVAMYITDELMSRSDTHMVLISALIGGIVGALSTVVTVSFL